MRSALARLLARLRMQPLSPTELRFAFGFCFFALCVFLYVIWRDGPSVGGAVMVAFALAGANSALYLLLGRGQSSK